MNDDPLSNQKRASRRLIVIIAAVFAGSLFFRILAWNGLEHTSLVFIGIPALLAVIVALMPTPRSATGTMFRVITLILLLSGIVFGEAFVCILFAAPIFYAVGGGIGAYIDYLNRHDQSRSNVRWVIFVAIAVAPASLEGVIPGFEFERVDSVTVVRRVRGSSADVQAALAQTPRFDRRLPWFLQLGFPTPGTTSGSGLEIGDVRRIEFRHGHHPGTLVFTVRNFKPGEVDFSAQADDSYITHWLSWREARVRWQEVGQGQTEVAWTLTYRRRLDPAWYFTPLERHGVRQAAGYLIDTLATPVIEPGATRSGDGQRRERRKCRPFFAHYIRIGSMPRMRNSK